MADTWQTLTQACQTLGISQRTLYRRIDKGEIETKLEDNRRLVLASLPDGKPIADVADTMADTGIAALKDQNDELKQRLKEKDSQIAELTEKLHDTEKKAILADELSADKERLQQQLDVKDGQIVELQKTLQQAQVNLDHNQQLLAYAQLPWWRKLGRKALPAPEDFVDMQAENEKQP